MTIWHLLLAARRHLIVVLIGMLLTAWVASTVRDHPGLYQMQTQIAVRPPERSGIRNLYLGKEYSLIATASVIQKMAMAGSGGAMTASSAAPLSGKGIKDGFELTLPNSGNQWAFDYNRPVLNIQAIGRTKERAQANLDEAIERSSAALTKLQDESNVPAGQRMTIERGALVQSWYAVGRKSRSLLATGILGMGLTMTVVLLLDERNLRLSNVLRFRRGDRAASPRADRRPIPSHP